MPPRWDSYQKDDIQSGILSVVWIHPDGISFIPFRIQFLPPHGNVSGGSTNCHPIVVLNYICVFAATTDEMFDHTKMVFKQLKDFNLKIKPKNDISSNTAPFSLVMYFMWTVYLKTQKRWIRSNTGQYRLPRKNTLISGFCFQLYRIYPMVCCFSYKLVPASGYTLQEERKRNQGRTWKFQMHIE